MKKFPAETVSAADAEQALRDSEERFRLATQAGKIGIWDWDIVGNEISWSESLYGIHGIEPGQIPATLEGFESLVYPDDRPGFREGIRRAFERDEPYDIEFRALRPDGGIVWLYTSSTRIIRDENGRPVRMLGATTDITDRKRVEFALRESEQRFAKAFNSAPLSLTISSLVTGKLVEVNDTFVEITGFSREEAIGRTTAELGVWARPSDREEELAAVEQAGKLRGREYVFRVRDGREIVGLLSAETLDIGGEPCALTVIEDITDRKKFEQALREADRRKDEFLATLAHELRNPLAPIRNGIEVLRRAAGNPSASEAVLPMMERQLAQMVRLVDDLLDVSRISRGKVELRRGPVEFSAVIRNALETCRSFIEESGHRLELEIPQESIYVDADLTRLSQVLANLLNNAAKYTPRGGVVRLAVEADDAEVRVRVSDNGIGIPAPMLAQVFDLFTQGDRSLEKAQSGLGIGLTISRRLVEMHDGRIEARSEGAGKGSEFIVHLPRLQNVTPEAASAAPDADGAQRRRILVVDDNEDSAESMALMLGMKGHETRTAHDGLEAIDIAEQFRPDLILLDIGMPKLNGYEACRRLREKPWSSKVTFVAMTGWGHEEDRRRSSEAGFDAHLIKPVDVRALEQLLSAS